MNLQEALDTANWLVEYAFTDEMNPEEILRVRTMRDVIYFMHAAAGVDAIRLDAYELGQRHGYLPQDDDQPERRHPDDPREEGTT